MFLLIGLLFGLIALLLLVGSFITIYRQQQKRSTTAETTGTVVDLERRMIQAGNPSVYCPVVEFTAPTGEKIRFVSEFGSLPARHRVGQPVKVRSIRSIRRRSRLTRLLRAGWCPRS